MTPFWKTINPGVDFSPTFINTASQKTIGVTTIGITNGYPVGTVICNFTFTHLASKIVYRRFYALRPGAVALELVTEWNPVTGAYNSLLVTGQHDTTSFVIRNIINASNETVPHIVAITGVNNRTDTSENGVYLGTYDLSQGSDGVWNENQIVNTYDAYSISPDIDVEDNNLLALIAFFRKGAATTHAFYGSYNLHSLEEAFPGALKVREIYGTDYESRIAVFHHTGNNFYLHCDGRKRYTETDTSILFYGDMGSSLMDGAYDIINMPKFGWTTYYYGLAFVSKSGTSIIAKLYDLPSRTVIDAGTIGTTSNTGRHAITHRNAEAGDYLYVIYHDSGDNAPRLRRRSTDLSNEWEDDNLGTYPGGVLSSVWYCMHNTDMIGTGNLNGDYYGAIFHGQDAQLYYRGSDNIYLQPVPFTHGGYCDGKFPSGGMTIDIDKNNSIATRGNTIGFGGNFIVFDSVELQDGKVIFIGRYQQDTCKLMSISDKVVVDDGNYLSWITGFTPDEQSWKQLRRFRVVFDADYDLERVYVTWRNELGHARSHDVVRSNSGVWINTRLSGRMFRCEISASTTDETTVGVRLQEVEAEIVQTQNSK